MIGVRIQNLMQKKGLNQVELAKKSGLGQSSISLILNNKRRNIELDTAQKLAKAFKCSIDELVYGCKKKRQQGDKNEDD